MPRYVRYIDGDFTMKELYKKYKDAKGEERRAYSDAIDIVIAQADADVQEVKHGKWIPNKFCRRIFYCSECGRHIEDGSISTEVSEYFPYCHCGAKMDGGENK